jgi:hypothetical protein
VDVHERVQPVGVQRPDKVGPREGERQSFDPRSVDDAREHALVPQLPHGTASTLGPSVCLEVNGLRHRDLLLRFKPRARVTLPRPQAACARLHVVAAEDAGDLVAERCPRVAHARAEELGVEAPLGPVDRSVADR